MNSKHDKTETANSVKYRQLLMSYERCAIIRWEARATNVILVSTSWNSAHITDTIIENGFFVWMVGNYDYLLLGVWLHFEHDRVANRLVANIAAILHRSILCKLEEVRVVDVDVYCLRLGSLYYYHLHQRLMISLAMAYSVSYVYHTVD